MTAEAFALWCNTELLVVDDRRVVDKDVGVKTAHSWLHNLKFKYVEHRKGIYVNGHERVDDAAHRVEFLTNQARFAASIHALNMVRYYHDEVAWNANDANR